MLHRLFLLLRLLRRSTGSRSHRRRSSFSSSSSSSSGNFSSETREFIVLLDDFGLETLEGFLIATFELAGVESLGGSLRTMGDKAKEGGKVSSAFELKGDKVKGETRPNLLLHSSKLSLEPLVLLLSFLSSGVTLLQLTLEVEDLVSLVD